MASSPHSSASPVPSPTDAFHSSPEDFAFAIHAAVGSPVTMDEEPDCSILVGWMEDFSAPAAL